MDNVINLFNKKENVKKSPEEIVENFHAKLDEVLNEFHLFNAAEKFQILESVVNINKDIFKLYMDLKKRHEFTINN